MCSLTSTSMRHVPKLARASNELFTEQLASIELLAPA